MTSCGRKRALRNALALPTLCAPGLALPRAPACRRPGRRSRRRSGSPMKVTVERAALLKSLGHVHRVVERRNTIPILANVLISAEKRQAQPEGHRSRSRSDRSRSPAEVVAGRRDHGAGAHVLRDRAQAARRRADRARRLRRPRRAVDPRRPLALHPADAAGKRLSRSRRRRDDATPSRSPPPT